MPRNITVTFADGSTHVYQNAPDNVTPDQVTARAASEFGMSVASIDGGRESMPTAAPTPPMSGELSSSQQPSGSAEIYAPDGFGGNSYNNETGRFDDAWIAQQEAAYQASLKDNPPVSPVAAPELSSPAPQPEQTSRLGAFGLGALDGISFGLDDEIGGGLAAVIPGIGKSSIWDGKTLSQAAKENIDAYRGVKKAAEDEHLGYFLGGGLAGGLVPLGGALGGAKAVSNLGKLGAAAKAGAAYGAAYGFGSGEGSIMDRLDGAALGAGVGAVGGTALHGAATVGGKALSPLARKLLPKLADAQFAKRQASNAYAATDAAVSSDLEKLVQNLSTSNSAKAKLSKTQKATLLSRIDDLEASYLPANEVRSLDLPPSTKAKLDAAMAKRHLLSDSEVQALRDGSPAGEAVAEGIEKARRLRAYVPEGQGRSGNRLAGSLGDAVGSAAGYKFGGPVGGAIGGTLGRAITQRLDARAAREAMVLAGKAPQFAKLPEVIAAREAGNGNDALTRLSSEALDARYLAERSAKQETERLTAEGKKVSIANARDNVRPNGGYRGEIYERTGLLPAEQDAGALKALKDGAITLEQFQAHLNDPAKLMPGNAGNALMDRLAAKADDGVLKRDPKWSPPPANASREAAQAAFREADAMWKQAQEADDALFSQTGLDRTERPTSAIVEEAFARREQAQRDLVGTGAAIRNPLAYAATAKGNQQRVSDSLSSVLSDPSLSSDHRETLATAIAEIGNTSSRERAQGIAMDALDRLGADHREHGRSILSPLIEQIKR